MLHTRMLALAAIAGTSLSLVACSGVTPPTGESGSSAAQGSKLNIACSQQEDFCQAISAAFEQQTGIKTTYVRLGSGEVLARLATSTGEFDVWSGGQAENHLIAHDRGFVEPYVSPNAGKLAEEYNDSDGIWSGFYTDSIGFCSNRAELDKLGVKAPTSWDDLLNSKLQGHVAMPHPATAGVGYMAMFTVDSLNGGDTAKTTEYFKALNTNIIQYSKSAATGTEMAGRGEAVVAIALDSDCVKAREAGFSDLVLTYPAEGTGYEVGAVSVLRDASNADSAKKYMDWILTTDAQDLYKDVPSFAAPTLAEAKLGDKVPPQDTVKKVEWDLRRAADSRDAMVQSFETDIASSSSAQ